MKVIVIGATGNVGRLLVKQLIDRGVRPSRLKPPQNG
jgi:uncharacterized protein YbjT (DUF2867 family)